MRCDVEAANQDHGLVVAIVTHPNGLPFQLCEPCLNAVYDTADERPEYEPVAAQYLHGWIERTLSLLPAPPTEGP